MDDIFDKIDQLAGRRSPYSLDEIEKAKKMAKKTGKSILDSLHSTTGKTLPPSNEIADLMEELSEIIESASTMDELTEQISAYNKPVPGNSHDSFSEDTESISGSPIISSKKGIFDSSDISSKKGTPGTSDSSDDITEAVNSSSFDGVLEAVSNDVFGQEAFLKKLIVAFKRPLLFPNDEIKAKNCLYIHGPEDSGKHYGLTRLVNELASRKVLTSAAIHTMDLSRYSASGKDHVFLQDLFSALQSEANVVLFENYEDCHNSYLTYITDLVIKGECYLQDRYILQNGQLIQAANAFARETVSTFSAAGKYLVFIGTRGVENLANVFGAPFVNAIGDIASTEPLAEESYRQIAKVQWDILCDLATRRLSFALTASEEEIISSAIAATGKNAGTKGLLSFFEQLLKGLATMKLEGDYPNDTKVTLSVDKDVLYAEIDGNKTNLIDSLPKAYSGSMEAVKEEMNQIVGLSEVKDYIFSLEEYYHTQKRRKEAGLKASDVSKHMIFTGNPGTGKTTIARIISRYLKAIGVLSGGQLIECSRADLVGRYVGHTAPLVNQMVKSALGGVLFIDEAYSLYRSKDDAFGLEAIDTLVKAMEDNRDDLIVILAGYSKEMEQFLEANSGLKSRFPNIIHFPDYTGQELLDITKITIKSKGYTLSEEAEQPLLDYYNKVQATDPATAGNGRLVRNRVEEAILNQSRRLIAEPEADLSLLILHDFVLEEMS